MLSVGLDRVRGVETRSTEQTNGSQHNEAPEEIGHAFRGDRRRLKVLIRPASSLLRGWTLLFGMEYSSDFP